MRSFGDFIQLSRPHFLVGGVLMFGLGAATAGSVAAAGYVVGQAMVTCAQVTAHFVNEFADVEPDRDVRNRTWFSGGSGVLVGRLAPVVAWRAALVSSTLAVMLAGALVVRSPAAAGLGLLALLVSWGYSLPPIRLLGTGWGELATTLVVVGLVPMIGSLSQGGSVTAQLAWSIAVLVPIHMAMMLAFEVPDLATDAAAGKTVLAVRIGRQRTEYALLGLLALGGLVAVVAAIVTNTAGIAVWSVGVIAPMTVVIAAALRRDRYSMLTMGAVATLAGVGAGLLVTALS
jgi:1,4-dihydroxy-2-naphthoate octaprenyltransferase